MRNSLPRARLVLPCPLLLAFVFAPLIASASRANADGDKVDRPVATPTSPTPYVVTFPLLVLDEAGRPAADVRPEDVSVTDNGAAAAGVDIRRDGRPVSYGLVIDNSGSVRPVLDAIVRSSEALVRATTPAGETFIMRFVDAKHTGIVEDFTPSEQDLIDALSEMYVEGGQTAVIDAVYDAAKHVAERNADRTHRRALVLITDGEDRSSVHKPAELFELLQRENVQVFVIGLTGLLDSERTLTHRSSRGRATELLESIAAESGGRAFFPEFGRKSAGELGEAVNQIANDLQSPYVVTYALPSEAADGQFHKVQIRVAGGKTKRRVFAAPGYFAPGGAQKQPDKQ
ncbi:MAG: VWA domain-containing protein [Acidobacteriota bacterium]|nr:VWA domain-containing protein [Acidobacteriota bacterium]